MSQSVPAGLPARARSVARSLRWSPERLLHPWRRRRALIRLGRRGMPRRVLLVCLGNICRSAYAEVALRRRLESLPLGPVVESAGFIAPGRGSPGTALAVAGVRGVDLSRHRSQAIEGVRSDDIDLIVVMDPGQMLMVSPFNRWRADVIVLGDLDPQPIDRRAIRDPYGQPETVFCEVFDRIDRCLSELVQAWMTPPGEGAI